MPLTKKGKKIMRSMKKQYGDKAKNVFYGSIVKGKITGAEGRGSGKLAKARATYKKEHAPTPFQLLGKAMKSFKK